MSSSVNKKLYCFPDTNLFIQCQPLEALDWSELGDFDAIDLIITRPVQKEIDAHKSKGNTRVASRSRAAASMLKEVFASELGYKEIRAHSPCVHLYVQLDIKPDLELADVLNYDEADDQLVGVASSFLKNNPSNHLRLVTDDVGPMASAKMAKVPCLSIPDSWLLPPEEDTSSKELKRLTQELERYKKAEPEFSLRWLQHDAPVEKIHVTLPCYEPLAPHQIAALIQRIQLRFPMAENFDDVESQKRDALPSAVAKAMFDESRRRTSLFREHLGHEVYVPATEKQISQYREAYAVWLQDCEGFLKKLHDHLAQSISWPLLVIELQNNGTRSANDALVSIAARGAFCIQPLKKAAPDEKEIKPPCLPSPPIVPRGEWQNKFAQYARVIAMSNSLGALHHGDLLASIHPRGREVDKFYYKSGRPSIPVSQYARECTLWRHQSDVELFELTLHPELKPYDVSGAVEVTIQATNLSSVFDKRLSVRIKIQPASTLEQAERLVEVLLH
jgi:hypothetical protein